MQKKGKDGEILRKYDWGSHLPTPAKVIWSLSQVQPAT